MHAHIYKYCDGHFRVSSWLDCSLHLFIYTNLGTIMKLFSRYD